MSGVQPDVTVVRLGHRPQRDKRITSHLGLTARAMGASHFILCGEADDKVLETMTDVSTTFGGDFTAEYAKGALRTIKRMKADGVTIVHLTMYGEPHPKVAAALQQTERVAIVVGGAKVPGEIYKLADYNVAVGHQPHSEVAALALFMDGLMGGVAGPERFPGARLEVHPHPSGKVVVDHSEDAKSSE